LSEAREIASLSPIQRLKLLFDIGSPLHMLEGTPQMFEGVMLSKILVELTFFAKLLIGLKLIFLI
jgi:hypothetical protein